jgi:hypothetical protein
VVSNRAASAPPKASRMCSCSPDGSFWYTGEGQTGDMTLTAGNKAIATHLEQGKRLLLFDVPTKGMARFEGEARYLGHHIEKRPDRDGNERNALIFELEFLTERPLVVDPGGVLRRNQNFGRVRLMNCATLQRNKRSHRRLQKPGEPSPSSEARP